MTPAFSLSTDPDPKASAALMFPEFAGKGQGSWSMLDVPSKTDRIGKAVRSVGGALLGAYGLIYATSSEIIHRSVYGMSYFMSTHSPGEMDIQDFLANTESQVVEILSAVSTPPVAFLQRSRKLTIACL